MFPKFRNIPSQKLVPFAQRTPNRASEAIVGRFHQYRGALLLALAAFVIWLNITFLIPLAMGAIFAVVLYPFMDKLKTFPLGNAWKAALVTFLFAISFLLPIGLIIVLGVEAALTKIQQIQALATTESGSLSVSGLVSALGLSGFIEWVSNFSPVSNEQLAQFATRTATAAGAMIAGILQNLLGTLPRASFATLVILITLFFLLIDGKRAIAFLRENSIFGPEQTESLLNSAVSLCYSVVVASIVAGAVQALLIFMACMITSTSGAVLVSLIAFILSFLPVIGTLPVTGFLTLQALIAGNFFAAGVFFVFIFLVGISDNIVRPYVLKGGAELHPLVGFVAAFGALDAIGFYGVFIGPVVAGLFFALLPMVTRSYGPESRG